MRNTIIVLMLCLISAVIGAYGYHNWEHRNDKKDDGYEYESVLVWPTRTTGPQYPHPTRVTIQRKKK